MLFQILNQDDDDADEAPVEEETPGEKADRRTRRRQIMEQLKSGARDKETIEIEVEESLTPFVQVFSPQGIEEMGLDTDLMPPFGPRAAAASAWSLSPKRSTSSPSRKPAR
jgi:ATP-dependent protease HslVU (ClpYQ) ATPase subunit